MVVDLYKLLINERSRIFVTVMLEPGNPTLVRATISPVREGNPEDWPKFDPVALVGAPVDFDGPIDLQPLVASYKAKPLKPLSEQVKASAQAKAPIAPVTPPSVPQATTQTPDDVKPAAEAPKRNGKAKKAVAVTPPPVPEPVLPIETPETSTEPGDDDLEAMRRELGMEAPEANPRLNDTQDAQDAIDADKEAAELEAKAEAERLEAEARQKEEEEAARLAAEKAEQERIEAEAKAKAAAEAAEIERKRREKQEKIDRLRREMEELEKGA